MLMLRMRVSGFAVVAVLGAVARLWAPGMGHAQTLDIGGHVGLYAPVGPLIDGGSSADGTSLPQKRLLMAGLVGADAVVWAATRFGFIASVAYAPSSVALTTPAIVPSREMAPGVPGVTGRKPTTRNVRRPLALPISLATVSLAPAVSAVTSARHAAA